MKEMVIAAFAAGTFDDCDVTIQHGATGPVLATRTASSSTNVEELSQVGPAAFEAMVAASDVMIASGGPGAVRVAHAAGTPVIAVPRRVALDEAASDHQWEFCRVLASRNSVLLADDTATLIAAFTEALAADFAGLVDARLGEFDPAKLEAAVRGPTK